jgi:curved DNA-binding protein CbpA
VPAETQEPPTATHYDTLGSVPTVTPAELRRAYLERARKLHPDQYTDRPPAERARAERSMQELNAAWTVLSDPVRRLEYDRRLMEQRPLRPTGPVVPPAARRDPERPRPRPRQVATEEEMEIRGFARLIGVKPLLMLVGSVMAVVAVAVALAGGGGQTGTSTPRFEDLDLPETDPIGCIDIVPEAVPVPCGNHDAVVYLLIDAGETCPGDLEAFYRDGVGGLFCAVRVPPPD